MATVISAAAIRQRVIARLFPELREVIDRVDRARAAWAVRPDLELRDAPPESASPSFSASLFVKPTTTIEITTLQYGAGADLQPLVAFDGIGHGRLTLHFEGGPLAVARLRDRLSEYLLLVAAARLEGA